MQGFFRPFTNFFRRIREFFYQLDVTWSEAHRIAATDSSSQSETKKKETSDAFSGWPQATTAWLGALGITAALAATGFIGKLALQQFLGIELGNWTALDLSIFAGRWAIDTVTIILNHLLAHPILFGLPIILYLTPTLFSFSLPQEDPRGQKAARISVLLATLGLTFVLTWCEMPTLSMNDWLMVPLNYQLNEPDPGLLKAREADLRLTLLVSKMDGVASEGSACGKKSNQLPPSLSHHLVAQYPAQAARRYLEDLYAASIVICLTALFTLYFHQAVEQPRLMDEFFRAMRLFDSFLLLPLVACLIPYMYGKLLYPTSFPYVTVTLSANNSSEQMLLMDETDKDISLLSTSYSIPYLVQIRRRDEIKSIQRYGAKDVLNTMLIQCKWLPTTSEPLGSSLEKTP